MVDGSVLLSARRDRPKSRILAIDLPERSTWTIRLAGLISQWISPCSWACWSPRQTWPIAHKPASPAGRASLTQRAQVDAIDIFHHEEVHAVRVGCIVGGHDMRMRQLTCDLDFTLKPADSLRVGKQPRIDQLEGDHPLHEQVFGLVGLPIPPAPRRSAVGSGQDQRTFLAAQDLFCLE